MLFAETLCLFTLLRLCCRVDSYTYMSSVDETLFISAARLFFCSCFHAAIRRLMTLSSADAYLVRRF